MDRFFYDHLRSVFFNLTNLLIFDNIEYGIDASNQVSTFHLLSSSSTFHLLSTNENQWDVEKIELMGPGCGKI